MNSSFFRLVVLTAGLCFYSLSPAKVLRLEVDSLEPVLKGKRFGKAGAYERVQGLIYFGFDPANPMNRRIVDLDFAPRNEAGLVEAWANFIVLRPVRPEKASGLGLVEVSNRGGKFSLRYFNRASGGGFIPEREEDFGDGLLMRSGITVIWVGWQFDVPLREDILRLHVPVAMKPDGTSFYGMVRSDWTVDEDTRTLSLSLRDHIPYRAVDPDAGNPVLTVRKSREAPRKIVPRSLWAFARELNGEAFPDDNHIFMKSGFKAGLIYELVYHSKDPPLVGLGLGAIRDIISYAKYDSDSLFPVRYGLAAGVSQTGRFLRHFLYQGFNTDEEGRKAYDGLMVMTAGAGRGSFNHRFAQPSRDGHRYSAFFIRPIFSPSLG